MSFGCRSPVWAAAFRNLQSAMERSAICEQAKRGSLRATTGQTALATTGQTWWIKLLQCIFLVDKLPILDVITLKRTLIMAKTENLLNAPAIEKALNKFWSTSAAKIWPPGRTHDEAEKEIVRPLFDRVLHQPARPGPFQNLRCDGPQAGDEAFERPDGLGANRGRGQGRCLLVAGTARQPSV